MPRASSFPQGGSPLERARAALDAGRTEEALALTRRLSQKNPRDASVCALHAEALLRAGEAEQALYAAERAGSNLACALLAVRALRALRRFEEGAARAGALVESNPGSAEAHAALAACLSALGRGEGALEHARAAAEAAPEDASLALALGAALLETGRSREAIRVIGAAAMRQPAAPALLAAFASALNYADQASPAYIAEAHRAFGRALERATPPLPQRRPTPATDRPLRVGFLSRDLHRHSCAYFLEPLLDALEPSQIETTCYSMGSIRDAFTDRLRGASAHWRDMPGAQPKTVIERVRADNIDVLVDLMGLSAGVRLAILAARPAPVQLTYLAYPNTTGLSRIDARIVDAITDPPAEATDALASERLLRLDRCFLCYRPDARAPDVRPRDPGEAFTFVSFNTIQKVNPTTLDLWARVLRQCPGARLLLKHRGASEPATRARIDDEFNARAVDPERVELVGHIKPLDEHLAQYHRADLALDTFPYCGTTTTCEAAWMGVPTLTLVGDRHSARVGASINTALGLDDLIARDPDTYVALASALAHDPAPLRARRLTLRDTMRASPLCDAPGLAQAFTAALRALWDERAAASRP